MTVVEESACAQAVVNHAVLGTIVNGTTKAEVEQESQGEVLVAEGVVKTANELGLAVTHNVVA